jgi:ATP-binding cassette subfamily C (CFTR/MRP) protein 1
LSAVDAHVGRDLFDKCIVDVLLDKKQKETKRKRTVILVTNALQYLSHPMLDRIVVLKDGSIVESGSFKELFSRKGSHFKSYLDTFNESMANESNDEVLEEKEEDIVEEAVEDILDDLSPPEHIDERRRSSILSISSNKRMSLRKSLRRSSRGIEILKKPAKLMTDEMAERKTGKVGWELYMLWAKAAGGVWVIVPVFLVFVAPQITDYLGMIWVSRYWGPDAVENSQLYYLKIYALLNLTGILLGVTKSIVPVIFALRAAVKVSFGNIICALISFKRVCL